MALQLIPIGIVLAALIFYTVLGGADFGAGFWQLTAGGGDNGRQIRDHAHQANAPVWEANHVWLILAITVLWTGYPTVFGSIFSTLAIPILIAAIGIIMRGLAYTLQNAASPAQRGRIDTLFGLSSVLTPFMLGTVIGAIASGRVPVGNARGDAFTSWIHPTSIIAGCLAVATGSFLAAVYLAADATRLRGPQLIAAFRTRALVAGIVAGGLSIAGLVVVRFDAHRLFDGLTKGWGLAAVIVSAVAGLASIALVVVRRFETARLAAAVAVTALLIGWAAAQRPYALPPTLTVYAAAAGNATMIVLIVAVAAGGVILFPSLALLFRLTLTGRFDPGAERGQSPLAGPDARRPRWAGYYAMVFLVAGVILLTIADRMAAHFAGVVALAAAGLCAFTAVAPDELAAGSPPMTTPVGRHHRRL
jgi:cytochrome d ubiquinol oxidase subunit II